MTRQHRSKWLVRRAAAGLAIVAMLGSACGQASTQERPEAMVLVDRSALDVRSGGVPALSVVSPAQGARVSSPVEITIELDNYALAAKGVSKDGEGHFHVVKGRCIEPGEVIGDDHTHVGTGAASVSIDLEPGSHELCVQLGDGFHTALAISEMLTVDVVADDGSTAAVTESATDGQD